MLKVQKYFVLLYYQYLDVSSFCVTGLCCMIAVSWYAYRVVQDFYDPFAGGTR